MSNIHHFRPGRPEKKQPNDDGALAEISALSFDFLKHLAAEEAAVRNGPDLPTEAAQLLRTESLRHVREGLEAAIMPLIRIKNLRNQCKNSGD